MTSEDQGEGFSGEKDPFPAGLRVLAVDDDPSCLKLVEGILRKCQYDVTAISQPTEALKMLRENKNRFDIVITDVNMPGMDGFRLLELIGLEMDLPVIMLSAHSDKEFVMKGIYHGACDYLVKPCRIAEIKNIWQHVVRKQMGQKEKNTNPNQDEQGIVLAETSDDVKVSRKRKEQSVEEEDEAGENENDDSSTQKKPRVVWSVELHRKFVAAVTQLTLEKAVPKKILDIMNIEGLTRENVASHLQKYRLYLKRISSPATQQENPAPLSSIDGFGLSGSRQFSTNPLSPYPMGGVLGRFNSPPLNRHGIVSPGLIMNNSFSLLGKFPQSQSLEFSHGIPTSIEFNPGFSYATNFPESRVTLDSSINTMSRLPAIKNQGALAISPVKSEFLEIDSNLLRHELGVHSSCSFPSTGLSYRHEIPSNSSRISYAHSPISLPSTTTVSNPLLNFRADIQRHDLIGSVVPAMNFKPEQKGEEHKQAFGQNPSQSAINSLPLANEIMGPLSERMNQNGTGSVKKFDLPPSIGQSNDNILSFGQHNAVEVAFSETSMNSNVNNFMNMAQDAYIHSGYDALDDMVNVMAKQEPNERPALTDGIFWM